MKLRIIAFLSLLIFPVQATGLVTNSDLYCVFDLGSVSIGSEVTHTFTISNNEARKLSIKQVNTSCDNIQILEYTSEIATNETGYVEVKFLPSTPGDVSCEISLMTDSQSIPNQSYFLKGEIKGGKLNKLAREKEFDIPDDFLTRRIRPVDVSNIISVDEVLEAQSKKQEVILIDIRKNEDFENLWIPGSVNIPLYLIKTKTFLKDKFLVLINEGYSCTQLEQEVNRLKDFGFSKVFILNGGLNAWRQAGAVLSGDPFMAKKLAYITPKILFLERHYENWIVIDSSSSDSTNSNFYIPEAVHIPYSNDKGGFLKKIQNNIRKASTNKFATSVAIFNDNGQGYEDLDRLIHEAGIKNVFYMEGGLEGYKVFLQRQALMRQPQKVKTEACQSCQ